MTEASFLSGQFEAHKPHLKAVAYRMLGSQAEAEDAVQEAWLRLSRSDTRAVQDLGAWLTTVVARVCLDALRSRRSRGEVLLEEHTAEVAAGPDPEVDAEREILLADSIGPALMVVLDTLAPGERVAFVLHDLFGVSFDDIAAILGRSSVAARQLASRARRRVRGGSATAEKDRERQGAIVRAFFAASRDGDFDALLKLLDPDVELRADSVAVQLATARRAEGALALSPQVRGAQAVARTVVGRAHGARTALVDGMPGGAWAPGGTPRAVFVFTTRDARIVAIELVADPARIRDLDVVLTG